MSQDIIECLTQQLNEIEVLKAMYPNSGEIVLSDKNILQEIKNFLHSKSEYIPNNIDFVIKLTLNELRLEVCINLPSLYPNEEPDIYIRCNQLNRYQETGLNSELVEYIKTINVGEVCLYTVITWLQDNAEYFKEKEDTCVQPLEEIEQNSEDSFSRLWVYSHHIYNKTKKERIQKKAKEFHLTGFCLPGKPGIICIEGDYSSCMDWWKNIKSMTWKKIMIKNTEKFNKSEKLEHQRFHNFEELQFKTPSNGKHPNMSEFSKYMIKLGFSQIFNELFDLCTDTENK